MIINRVRKYLLSVLQKSDSSLTDQSHPTSLLAAEVLAGLMDGESPASEVQLIEPLGVATRQSTDVVAIDDRDLSSS